MTEKEKEEKKEKKIKPVTMVYSVAVILVAYLIIIGIMIYLLGMNNFLVQKTAAIIPYPAALVDKKIITLTDLSSRVLAAKKFYESQDFSAVGFRIDFSTDDGKRRLFVKEKDILDKMIEDAAIEREAKKRNIVVTSEMISQEVERKMQEYGSNKEVEEKMASLYGWTTEDFKKNIVKPDIYQQKLYDEFRKSDEGFVKAKEKIETAQKELKDSKNFEIVVGKYSEGDSAKNRGDLGWFSQDEMLPEIAKVAFSLDKGKTSDIIESALGYHIIKIEEKKTENDEEKVHIRQIFVRVPYFSQWLADQEKEMDIFIPLKGFFWDKDKSATEFKDEEMRKFQEKMKNDSSGDISVLF